ncbi:MAG: ankyrin repeat protein, partial [Candidatus Paceibacteria bacterium]
MHQTRRQILASLGTILAVPALGAIGYSAAAGLVRRRNGPFLKAVREGDLELVRSLLDKDESLATARDELGRSAFVLASVRGHMSIADLLLGTGVTLDIVEAVLAGDWDRFAELGDAHPEQLNKLHPIGGTPLYAAALSGTAGFWRLRYQGCLPNLAPEGGSGFTPARGALECAQATWAQISVSDLCGNGSDVNARQRGGSSVLHGAVERLDTAVVRLAIRKGANLAALED